MLLEFMQDGPAITHNDLSSAEDLRLILEAEATSSLRETVTSMRFSTVTDVLRLSVLGRFSSPRMFSSWTQEF